MTSDRSNDVPPVPPVPRSPLDPGPARPAEPKEPKSVFDRSISIEGLNSHLRMDHTSRARRTIAGIDYLIQREMAKQVGVSGPTLRNWYSEGLFTFKLFIVPKTNSNTDSVVNFWPIEQTLAEVPAIKKLKQTRKGNTGKHGKTITDEMRKYYCDERYTPAEAAMLTGKTASSVRAWRNKHQDELI